MSLYEQCAVQAPTWETHSAEVQDGETPDRVFGEIVSECDAWLYGKAAKQTPSAGIVWSTAEVDAYFARRRDEAET